MKDKSGTIHRREWCPYCGRATPWRGAEFAVGTSGIVRAFFVCTVCTNMVEEYDRTPGGDVTNYSPRPAVLR